MSNLRTSTRANSKKIGQPMVNGDKFPSQTLNHLKTYPLTNDIANIYSSYSVGRASISITQAVYDNLVAPVLPLFRTPYQYVAPYVDQADTFGDDALNALDDRFPAAKETGVKELKGHIHDAAGLPRQLVVQSHDYVFDVWEDEYSKTSRENNGRKDIGTTFWALLSATLRIIAEVYLAITSYLRPKRDSARQNFHSLKQSANNVINQTQNLATEKKEQAKSYTADKKEEAKQTSSTYLQYGSEQLDRAANTTARNAEQTKEFGNGMGQLGQEKVDVAFHFTSAKAEEAEQRAGLVAQDGGAFGGPGRQDAGLNSEQIRQWNEAQ